jgi:hypothetical protein
LTACKQLALGVDLTTHSHDDPAQSSASQPGRPCEGELVPLIGRYWSRSLLAVAICAGNVRVLVGTAVAAPSLLPLPPLDVPVVVPVLFAGPPPTVPGGVTRANNQPRRHHQARRSDLRHVPEQRRQGRHSGREFQHHCRLAKTGALVTTYQLPGRCDGLTAELKNHRLLATVNEPIATPTRDRHLSTEAKMSRII